MGQSPPDPEAQFGELLAQYDEALAMASDATPVISPMADAAVQQRFERVQACLRLLERDRRRQGDLARQEDASLLSVVPARDADHVPRESGAHASDSDHTSSSIEVPRQIGRFRILRRLGSGGFGVVFLANDPILHRLVAVKIPRPETLTTPDLQQRFIRESQIVARMTHPHLVSIHEAGQAGAIGYQVTAYCAGGTLTSWLRAGQSSATAVTKEDLWQGNAPKWEQGTQCQLPIKVAVELLIGLAEGVQYAHEHGILHRDLKPSNILLHPKGEWSAQSKSTQTPLIDGRGLLDAWERTGKGDSIAPGTVPLEDLCTVFQPKVSDFGLAKMFDDPDRALNGPNTEVGSPSPVTSLAGTPQYMAPEQIEGDGTKIGPATDVFGLGTILYEVLAGQKAFPNGLLSQRDVTSGNDRPTPLRQLRPDCSRDLEAICLKCLSKPASERYSTARGLVDDLRAFQRGESVVARPWPRQERFVRWFRRQPAVASLLTISACLLLGLLGFGAWHLHQLSKMNDQLTEKNDQLNREYVEREKQIKATEQESQRADEQTAVAQAKNEQEMLQRLRAQDLSWIARQRKYTDTMKQVAELSRQQPMTTVRENVQSLLRDASNEDLQGFEWRYQWDQGRNFRDLKGHTDTISAATLTPDGKTCFSTSHDGTVRRWDVSLCQLLETWTVSELVNQPFVRINKEATRAVILRNKPGDDFGEVIGWDLIEGRERSRQTFTNQFVESIAISPDGTWAVIGGATREFSARVAFFQLDSGFLNTVKIAANPNWYGCVGAIAIAPNGKELAIAVHSWSAEKCWDHQLLKGIVAIDETRTATNPPQAMEIASLENLKSLAIGLELNLEFSRNGQRVALTATNRNRIEVWDWNQRQLIEAISGGPDPIGAVCFDATGDALAVHAVNLEPFSAEKKDPADPNGALGVTNKELMFWDFHKSKPPPASFPSLQIVTSIKLHEPSATWVIGENGGRLSLWQPEQIEPHLDLKGHQPHEAWGLVFAPNGKTIYSVGDDAILLAWNVATGEVIATGEKHASLASCVAASPDGRWIATGSYDDDVVLWGADSLQVHAVLNGHTHVVRTVAFSPDSQTLASAGRDKVIRLWRVSDGRLLESYKGQGGEIRAVEFLSANNQIVEANNDGQIVTWDFHGTPHPIRWEREAVNCMAFAPAGLQWTRHVVADVPTTTSLVKTTSARELLIYGCKLGGFKILHLPTGEIWLERNLPTSDIRSVAFAPDGCTFAVATADKAVHLWHVASGQELLKFADLPAPVNQMAFSPDGEILAAALHDGTIRLWRGPKTEKP